jgi:ATP-dependent exoDNAse (exonuclease V) alpha subunit
MLLENSTPITAAENQLNPGQQAAVNLLDTWEKTNEKWFLLEAAAGFGKSFVVKYWLNKNKHLKKNTVLTAPTHQALEQLAKDIPGVSAITIHSLLGYRPSATETEKQILVKARGGGDKRIDYRYVIIDEAFYVPKVLIKAIDEVYQNTRFIVLGDRKQLQAVNESQSALIDILPFIKYKATLTQNMRSNCELQKQLVLNVGEQGWNYDFTPNLITRAQVIKQMCDLIDQNQLDFLFIGYRHVVVDQWAETIRELIYDRGKEEFYQPGEVVRLSGVVDKDNFEVIRNNEVVKIVGTCSKDNPEFIIVERDGGETVLLDLDYNDEIGQAKIAASKAKDYKLWTYYHRLVRTYPKISSKWAITAHSSQGCTVDRAYIDFRDLKREGSNELLLVAVSRSRELVKGFQ